MPTYNNLQTNLKGTGRREVSFFGFSASVGVQKDGFIELEKEFLTASSTAFSINDLDVTPIKLLVIVLVL